MITYDLVVLHEKMKELDGRDLSGASSAEIAMADFSENEIENSLRALLAPSNEALSDMRKHGLQCAGLGNT